MNAPPKAWRPCCGECRLTGLVPTDSGGWQCDSCKLPWDGSEVTPDKLPAILEVEIAAGRCTRAQAYDSFLLLDDLADATADGDITVEQGTELVVQDAFKVIGKSRPS